MVFGLLPCPQQAIALILLNRVFWFRWPIARMSLSIPIPPLPNRRAFPDTCILVGIVLSYDAFVITCFALNVPYSFHENPRQEFLWERIRTGWRIRMGAQVFPRFPVILSAS